MTSIASVSDSKRISYFESKYYKKQVKHDYFKIFSHFVQSSSGTCRLFKLLIDCCRWPCHFANTLGLSQETIKKLFNAQNDFKFISKNLILAKYPTTIVELNKSFDDYQKAEISDITKRRNKLATKVAETISDTSFFIQLGEVLSLYSLGALSPIIDFTGKIFSLLFYGVSLKINREEYLEHKELQKIFKEKKPDVERLQTICRERINSDWLDIAKNVASIALSTIFVLGIVLETTIVSEFSLLMLSTCSIVLAIWSHFYRESMTYPMVV